MRILATVLLYGAFASARSDLLAGQTIASAAPVAFTLSGLVVDDRRQPVASAEVTVSQRGRTIAVIRTDAAGVFTAPNIAAGPTDVRARRLGYKATSINLDLDDSITIEVIILPVATEVAPVIIETGGKLSRFYDHKKKGSIGVFFDQAQIEKQHVRFSSELFRTIPGASLRASSRYGYLIRFHGCRPKIWLDGVPISDAELDEVLTPQEIGGIEIYSAAAAVPAQYMDTRGCGTIIVWTRG
jgi:hypothetical protein